MSQIVDREIGVNYIDILYYNSYLPDHGLWRRGDSEILRSLFFHLKVCLRDER